MSELFESELRLVIHSAVFDESRKFYEQILKLPIVTDWDHGDGQLGVIYELGKMYLEIVQEESPKNTNAFYIYSNVSNVDELWEKLQGKVKIIDEIKTQPWHHRNFSIEDPNGYKIKFFSEVS